MSANRSGSRTFSLARATNAIESQFLDLAPVHLEQVAGGEDFHVFIANRKWIFRFPQRRSSNRKLKREQILLPRIAATLEALHIRVPCYEKRGMPTPEFPLYFAGYRVIPGVAADRVEPGKLNQRQLARVLGRAIGRMHLISPDVLAQSDVPRDTRTPRRVMAQLRARADAVQRVLPPVLRRAVGNYLSGNVTAPKAFSGSVRFLHNDLCPDHILIDPAKGRLIGLIDFSDASFGDPALDFANLYSWLGRDFVLELLRWYQAPRDPEFELRVGFYARSLSLVWVADAARKGDKKDVSKHVSWVSRAFQDKLRAGCERLNF